LVCLFMLILYRLPGFLACIALLGHTVIRFYFYHGQASQCHFQVLRPSYCQ
jgi:hypothetical protein